MESLSAFGSRIHINYHAPPGTENRQSNKSKQGLQGYDRFAEREERGEERVKGEYYVYSQLCCINKRMRNFWPRLHCAMLKRFREREKFAQKE